MPSSIAQQFGNMLSSRWSLPSGGQDAPPPPPSSKQKAIHETVTYPRVRLAPDNNSCLNTSMSYEHVLTCGHIVETAKPDEPCAPNCHHVANRKSPGRKNAPKQDKELDFYCDACVETENETRIPGDMTSTAAEHKRLELRQAEAKKRGKQIKYRKCYIGLKITSVPCHSDGAVRNRYTPRNEHHPFDTAVPQVGDNFFEDMLVNPTEDPEPASDTYTSAFEHLDHSAVDSSPVNLGDAGTSFLRYTQSQAVACGKARVEQQKTSPISYPDAGKIAAQATRGTPATALPAVIQNSETAALHGTSSPQRSRKRPIVIDDDDEDDEGEYTDALEEEAEVFKWLAKPQKDNLGRPPPPPSSAKKKARCRRKRGW